MLFNYYYELLLGYYLYSKIIFLLYLYEFLNAWEAKL